MVRDRDYKMHARAFLPPLDQQKTLRRVKPAPRQRQYEAEYIDVKRDGFVVVIDDDGDLRLRLRAFNGVPDA